jgi:ABC-type multidrug transport system fused ATPase/permease subunit
VPGPRLCRRSGGVRFESVDARRPRRLLFHRPVGHDPHRRAARERRSWRRCAEGPGRFRARFSGGCGAWYDLDGDEAADAVEARLDELEAGRPGVAGCEAQPFALQIGPVAFRIGSALATATRRAANRFMPAIRQAGTRCATSRCGSSRRRCGGAGCGPRWRSRAIMCCLTRRRWRSSTGLLAAEMGMNLQMALGQKQLSAAPRRHASRKEGRALILTGESGAGKSTLAALLGERGWRLMGDEFALLDPGRRTAAPVPARGEPQERRDSASWRREAEAGSVRAAARRYAEGVVSGICGPMRLRSRRWPSRRAPP